MTCCSPTSSGCSGGCRYSPAGSTSPPPRRSAAGDDVAVDDIVDILDHLVDKSLVSVIDRHDGTRYRLLQTMVDYGRERLGRGRRGRRDPGPASAVDGRVRGGGRARPARSRPAAVDPPAGLRVGQRPCRDGLGGRAGTGCRRGGDGRRAGVRLVHHRRGCRRAGVDRPSPRDRGRVLGGAAGGGRGVGSLVDPDRCGGGGERRG